jgi:hypothetical protein
MKVVSGRAPEQRGNGLKFVLANMRSNKRSLYFQSGDGCCVLSNGVVEYQTGTFSIPGFLAILDFKNIKVLAPSWADEFITGIKAAYSNQIEVANIESPAVKAVLEVVLD